MKQELLLLLIGTVIGLLVGVKIGLLLKNSK